MLATYYLYFNCSKFHKKGHDLEINKKKSCKALENKSRKSDISVNNASHEAQGPCKAREYVGHKAREAQERVERGAREHKDQ